MLAWPELQAQFRDDLLGGDRPPRASLVAEIVEDGLAADARLAVYRHHVRSTLTDALKATYPVVTRLVDEQFFGYMADRYVSAHPPAGPCLFEFGESFADFVGTFEAARHLVYLADVARLEWAMNRALHAEETSPIDPAALAAVPPAAVASTVLHCEPSLTLLASPWPIDRIWRANQPGAESPGPESPGPDSPVDLAAGDVRLEVRRAGDDVGFRTLDSTTHAFRAAIAGGRPLGEAADAALALDPGFDLGAALHALLDDGVIVALTFDDTPEEES